MTASAYRRIVTGVVAVVLLAGIYGLARVGHPAAAAAAAPAAKASRAQVTTATRVCPAPGSAGATASSLALASMSGPAAAGSAAVTPLTPAGAASPPAPAVRLSRPGLLQTATVPAAAPLTAAQQAGRQGSSRSVRTVPGRGGVIVSAAGAMAAGLAVEQVRAGPGGLAAAQCGSPATSFWFAGPGVSAAGSVELYLANAGSQAADAQVQVLANAVTGPPDLGSADNGISVPAHGMVVQSLNGLLKGSAVMAVNVTTTVGQVVAAVHESKNAGEAGIWLPAVQPPSRHLVLPGLPAAAGAPRLYVAVPGTAAAQVRVTAITRRGSYQPTGGTGLDLPGGAVNAVPLGALSGTAGAVSVTSSVPVVAVMAVPGGPAGSAAALAASAGPVVQQGVLAASPAGAAGQTQLVLSAPGRAAAVRVTTVAAGQPASGAAGQVVSVAAKSSAVAAVPAPAGSRASQLTVVVTPLAGSGPVYAAEIISVHGQVHLILPVPSSPVSIALPGVRESVTAVAGG